MTNIIINIIYIILGILIFIGTREFPSYEYSCMNSASFPRVIALLMILFSVIQLLRDNFYKQKKRNDTVDGNPPTLYLLLVLGIMVVYVLLIKLIGFLIPTALILIVFSIILQKGKLRIIDTFIVPVITIILISVMFYFLNVPLFKGIIF